MSYREATEAEVSKWPDASVSFSKGKKHNVAILSYKGRTRKVVYADTPSDSARGLKNHIGQVRIELRGLGASKPRAAASPNRDRTRNRPQRTPVFEKAPVASNPFDALTGIRDTLPPAPPSPDSKPSLWGRVKLWIKEKLL